MGLIWLNLPDRLKEYVCFVFDVFNDEVFISLNDDTDVKQYFYLIK
jgi:hypothetical protein